MDPTQFKGNVLGVTEGDGNDTPLDPNYLGRISRDYNDGKEVFALPWDDVYEKSIEPYYQRLRKPFVEVTEERFWDILECLPPMRWNKLGTIEFFFISEAYTGPLHACLVRKGDKYYEALREKFISKEDLLKQIEELC